MPDEIQKAETFRVFIALPAPDAIKAELEALQRRLREQLPGDSMRWTGPEQIHLTLKFLGDVPSDKLEDLSKAVAKACQAFAPLHLRAERIGFFPQIRFPRVVWAWVHDDLRQLPLLHSAINEATRRFTSQPEEKDFTGHLTLGHTRNIKSAQARLLAEIAQELSDRSFGAWTADAVEIMRGRLSSSGSEYSRLASIPLTGPHLPGC
jgi:2'-5' RNA ligase